MFPFFAVSDTMGDHHEPFEIPHYTKYSNYQHIPELVAHEKRLAAIGLKDPWIRNHVHLFGPGRVNKSVGFRHFWRLLSAGWKGGVAAAVAVISLEEGYMYFKHGHTSWGAHH
uniref:NADH dehydrogenase [ubiquinone] 1 beta subcomplex subunit 3 n=1 Tax=Syphacia muris TaxID=451379 RepID=A0A0N5AG46_9BILA